MIHFDPRWSGPHGIGRFSDEVVRRLPDARPLRIGVRKLSLLDPLATTLAARGLRSGSYFTPGFNPPLRCPVPFAFCIHDLIHLHFAAESTPARRAYYRLVVRPAAYRAACVLTVSAHARGEILEWTGLPPERVAVAGNGVAAAFRPAGVRHDPGFPYFLYVGRRVAHKNVERLVAAHAASRCHREVRLLFAEGLDDEQLAAHYRGAVALALPSLYEGFGLPVIEAMACGTPVLASTATALPETAGEGNALLVDPLRVDEIAGGLDRLAEDANLRATLRARGLERARAFSWDAVAQRARDALAAR
ncbi:MAG TPA: glycosyltransferase family 1 protein [Burkholderiales bacterium]|nr:glycosyltransferase family 1 protein [Burkholderiales bacterium]